MGRARMVSTALLLTIALVGLPAASVVAVDPATPIPSVTGSLASSATSHPFNGVEYDKIPRDLHRDGYVEEEFIVSGAANVYAWPIGEEISAIDTGPYTTRIVVRRPIKAKDFSGHVVVEMLNPTSLHDLDIVWSGSQDHFIRNGDVWVGLTVKPSSISALKVYDAARYGALSMGDPAATPCTPTTFSGATAASENGLAWDIVSQVGALLKAAGAGSPLAGFDVDGVFLTGYSQTAGYQTTYINAVAQHAVMADGSPVYDGHLPIAGANFPTPISDCGARPVRGGDRWVIQTPGAVPVIAIQTLSDFYALNGFYSRRADATGPDGNYRLYEIAGAGHVWSTQVAYTPSGAELVRSGFTADWWDPYCNGELTTFPLEYAMNAAFDNLVRWAMDGVPAPIAARIAVTDPTSPTAVPLRDAAGNVIGGVRTPAVDVPLNAYYGTTAGTGTCTVLWGSQIPLTDEAIDAGYPRHSTYLQAVRDAAATAVDGGWITAADAKSLTIQAKRSGVGTGN